VKSKLAHTFNPIRIWVCCSIGITALLIAVARRLLFPVYFDNDVAIRLFLDGRVDGQPSGYFYFMNLALGRERIFFLVYSFWC